MSEPASLYPALSVFVGRSREVTQLYTALGEAMAGRGQMFFLVGEPGIGKTRLADELVSHAVQQGALGLWGRCWEGAGAPALWPWVQGLRSYVAQSEPEALQAEMGPGIADVVRIIPELRHQFPALPQLPVPDSPSARFGFFDSLTSFLRVAATRQPLVFVLDDLHWADSSSLLLLQFLSRNLRGTRIFVLGTYRNEEIGPDHPLAEVLGSLARESLLLPLGGLAEDDVALLVEAITGRQQPPRLIRAVCEKTEGNPFFVSEIIRWLAASGQLDKAEGETDWTLSLPQGVRETIRRRLARLSDSCQLLLSSAAVIGREFSLPLLQRVVETASPDENALLSLLGEACTAQVLAEIPGAVGGYRFTHALMRETLYEDLALAERVQLHRRIGEALEALYTSPPDTHAAELANHFFHAVPSGSTDKALTYLIQAAEQAKAVFAYEAAIDYAQRGIDLNTANETQRGALLLIVGESQDRLGETAKAKETLFRAADLARQLGNSEYLARAAVGFPISVAGGVVYQPLVALCEEALESLHAEESAIHAKLLARLSVELYFSPEPERRLALSQQAIDMARVLGDPATLAYALNSRYWALWGPQSTPEERIALAFEVLQAARQARDFERIIVGHGWRAHNFLVAGDMIAFDTELSLQTQVVEKLQQPQHVWFVSVFHVIRAIIDGRLEEAEQLAQESLGQGQAVQNPNAMAFFGVQLFVIRSLQGRLAELEFIVKSFVAQSPAQQGGLANLAFLYSELGKEAEARAVFEQFAEHQFAKIPRDATWVALLSILSKVCAFLHDRERAPLLYTLLLPYARQNALVGPAACIGSVSLSLGLLAATVSRWDDAFRHFEDALTFNARLGARPFVVQTQQAYAQTLLLRNAAGDQAQARALLQRARTTAQEIGMHGLFEKTEALLAQIESSVAPPMESQDGRTASSESGTFRKEGAYWTLSYAGTTIRLRNAKGLQYLSCLLRDPGQEFHVFDLVTLVDPPPVSDAAQQGPPVRQRDTANDDPQTDRRARTAYRQRAAELQHELEEADQLNDASRIERLQEELSFLSTELASAYGFKGHAHQRNEEVEKARKAVSNRIRASLTQIKKAHPELWRHLFAAVKTGTFCSYQPQQPIIWYLTTSSTV